MTIEMTGHTNVLDFMVCYLGTENQIEKAQEEMSELHSELSESIEFRDVEKIVDEIADVYLTLHQLKTIYDSTKVMERIFYKLNLLKRMVEKSQHIEKIFYPALDEVMTVTEFRRKIWEKNKLFTDGSLVKFVSTYCDSNGKLLDVDNKSLSVLIMDLMDLKK